MLQNITVILSCLFMFYSCSASKSTTMVSDSLAVPEITFVDDVINLGDIEEGSEYTMIYEFTNTGKESLKIDLVTACKCTSLDWPPDPIAPGTSGRVKVVFDSTGFSGEVKKTIDIIANTDPIIVEAHFVANVKAKE